MTVEETRKYIHMVDWVPSEDSIRLLCEICDELLYKIEQLEKQLKVKDE